MTLGLHSDSLGALSLPEVLDFCVMNGLSHVELGTGNWSGARLVDLQVLLASADRRKELLLGLLAPRTFRLRPLTRSAPSCGRRAAQRSAA